MYVLCLLLLVPSPNAKPPAIVGAWTVEWGSIKPYQAVFAANGEYYSDEPWGDGRWALDEQGRYCFSDKSGIWVIRIDDWPKLTGTGQRIERDGTLSNSVPVKISKPKIE